MVGQSISFISPLDLLRSALDVFWPSYGTWSALIAMPLHLSPWVLTARRVIEAAAARMKPSTRPGAPQLGLRKSQIRKQDQAYDLGPCAVFDARSPLITVPCQAAWTPLELPCVCFPQLLLSVWDAEHKSGLAWSWSRYKTLYDIHNDTCRGQRMKRKLQPSAMLMGNLPRDLLLGPSGTLNIPRLRKPWS